MKRSLIDREVGRIEESRKSVISAREKDILLGIALGSQWSVLSVSRRGILRESVRLRGERMIGGWMIRFMGNF